MSYNLSSYEISKRNTQRNSSLGFNLNEFCMKRKKRFAKVFGVNEHGFADFPPKFSNVQISRILYGNLLGCSYCFPHGWETSNSTISKRQRNWKKFRKTKWKEIPGSNDSGILVFISIKISLTSLYLLTLNTEKVGNERFELPAFLMLRIYSPLLLRRRSRLPLLFF